MARFFMSEFQGFEQSFNTIVKENFPQLSWYIKYKTFFLLFFHLLFIIDVGIASIGYSFGSRWLDNRTKSVDATWSGWIVALLCYPPLNTAFTSQFISYQGLPTHQLITGEHALAVVLAVVLLLYVIYVWATVALGFKFSNLTNRGIVSQGPYSIVRHPAYAAKNMAWWVDNTFVLTNIWATVGMILWNVIYILRALTEERHLGKDKMYDAYCKKVKYKFIPKII
jgi:protein-S-isoprenylcysteine O-methyltransferase Ste14